MPTPSYGDPWAHVVPAGCLSLGLLGVREPAAALPRDSWHAVLAGASFQVLADLSGPVFPFCAPRPHSQPRLLARAVRSHLPSPSRGHTLGLLETQGPSALLAPQQASGTSPHLPPPGCPQILLTRPSHGPGLLSHCLPLLWVTCSPHGLATPSVAPQAVPCSLGNTCCGPTHGQSCRSRPWLSAVVVRHGPKQLS